MGGGGAAMWPLFLVALMIVVILTTMHDVSIGLVALDIIARDNISNNESRESEGTRIRVIESEETENSESGTAMRRVRAERETYLQDPQQFSFATRAHIARLAIRHLPPVICFRGDETSTSQRDCSICMEDFQIGELIQPFGSRHGIQHMFLATSTLGYVCSAA
ncbi:hypothetical protein CR513_03904, partial [Mucuna pruriens]